MPSGITSDIYEGKKEVTLRDYLMTVGRQMGYAIMQRDDDPTKPVEYVEPSTRYYDESIAEAQAVLARIDGMSVEQAQEEANAEYAAELERWKDTERKKLELRDRYEAMIAQVEGWEPDPLIADTKTQAVKYLRESIEFDVGAPGEEMRYYRYPIRQSGAEWLNAKRDEAKRTIERGRQNIREERERTAERNRYIAAFLDSLPQEVVR